MCHNYNKHFLLSLLTLATAFSTKAQEVRTKNGENSPYSKFALGDQRNGSNALMRSMATISSAYASPFAVNTDNPASYAALRLTTYEAGAEASGTTLLSGSDRVRAGQVAVAYMDIGIPVSKNAGIALGLRPYSKVFYSFADTGIRPNFGNAAAFNNGQGSVNYAYIGGAGRYRGFSVGINFGYLFGPITQTQEFFPLVDSPRSQNSVFINATRVGGLYFKLGAMYDTKLNSKLTLRVGGTASLNQDVSSFRDQYWYSITRHLSSDNVIRDTVFKEESLEGHVVLPLMYSFGVQLAGTDKWMVGVDYSGGQWSEYRNFGVPDSTDNSYRAAIGGEYTPNATSIRNYFQRVTYRAGFFYGRDYIDLRSTDINYWGVTFGGSFPFRRSSDRIHAAVELGNRGTTANNLVREKFVRLALGISLNDRWFIKRKYE